MNDKPDLAADLAEIVGARHVLVERADTQRYEEDWRGRYRGRARAVVRPASTEEVSAVVSRCRGQSVAIVPQGGNTGLCGGATPHAGGDEVVVSLERMNRVRSVDRVNRTIAVDAGCTLAAVQTAAADVDCLFPLSLASEGSCQIGGNLSTNAGGVHVLRYGNMRDLVLGIEVVLPDGRVWDGMRHLRKDNTGYDLKQLFIGAEGTVGIVTAAVLKLFPRPRGRAVAWLAVPDPTQAIALLQMAAARCGGNLDAFELIGASALELVLRHIPGTRAPLAVASEWNVLIELAGTGSAETVGATLEALLADAMARGLVADAVVARSEAQAEALWRLRENISEAQRIEGFSVKHDISLPLDAMVAFLDGSRRELEAHFDDLRLVVFGHLGDGNLHYNLSAKNRQGNDLVIARSAEVNRIVHDRVAACRGSISAEHGLGQLKREEILRYRSPVEDEIMRAIKRAFDPDCLMNPGKLL